MKDVQGPDAGSILAATFLLFFPSLLVILVCLEIGLVLCDQLALRGGSSMQWGAQSPPSHLHSPEGNSEALNDPEQLMAPSQEHRTRLRRC